MENWHNTDELDDLLGSELDLDQAWSEFKKDKKKTRRFPIWWCFGFGSIFLLGTLWVFQNNSNLKINVKDSVAVDLHAITTIPADEKTNLSSAIEKDISQEELLSTTSTSIKKVNNVYNENTSTVEENHSSINTPDLEQMTYSEIRNQKINSNKGIQDLFNEEKSKNNNSSYPLTLFEMERPENNSPKIFSNKQLLHDKLIPLPFLLLPIALQQLEEFPMLNEFHPSFSSKEWRIGITYMLANGNRNISAGEEAYTQRRQDEEQFLEVNRMEFSVTKQLSKSLFLRSGVMLSQYRSKIEEDIQTLTSPVEYDNVIIETHTQNDLTQEIIGTAEGSQLTVNRFTRFQEYQTLSLPLQVGVQIPLHRNWQFEASTGVAVSVYGQAKGQTFSSILPDGIYAPLSQLDYRKIGLLEGIGQLSVERSFGNTSFRLGVHGTMDLNNRLKLSTFGIDKFSSYGIQIGAHRFF